MLFDIPWTEWLGYAASIVVAFSLLMKSLIRLRWINLAGSILFAAYGFLIGAWPVGVFNTSIIFINIWYLASMYSTRETFELMKINSGDLYLKRFIQFYKNDIKRFFPEIDVAVGSFKETGQDDYIGYYILRDLTTAGMVLGKKEENGMFHILLDYVAPAYRDFKTGRFVFDGCVETWRALGVKKMVARSSHPLHADYLLKMGFVAENGAYTRSV